MVLGLFLVQELSLEVNRPLSIILREWRPIWILKPWRGDKKRVWNILERNKFHC